MNKMIFVILSVLLLLLFSFFNQKISLRETSLSIFDVHEHLLNEKNISKLIGVMDSLKISKMILLNSLSDSEENEDNMNYLLKIKKEFPDKFLVFYTLDPNNPKAIEKLNKRISEGIDGLKFYHGVIWIKTEEENISKTIDFWYGEFNITSIYGPINSSQMKKIFKIAEKEKLPVIIHVESSTYQLEELKEVLKEFLDVKFICPHFCGVEKKLQILEGLLNNYPNLYTDISAWQRVGSFATKDPKRFREFFIKHQDRILWGSDIVIENQTEDYIYNWMKCHADLLEKKKFYCFLESSHFSDGLNLPEETLRKIHKENPNKIFS